MLSSRSSSRSPSRKRHRKHRHRSRRSRSRTPRIHINPLFGYQQQQMPSTSYLQSTPMGYSEMGYSASQLLQTNTFLENEVNRLKQQSMVEQNNLQMTLNRLTTMEQQVQTLGNQKRIIERRCEELSNERRTHLEVNNELKHNFSNIEYTCKKLEGEIKSMTERLAEKEEEINNMKYQIEVGHHQIDALKERNRNLKQKCEEVVLKNRQQQIEIESKKKIVEEAKVDVQKMVAEVECVKLETRRLTKELEGALEKESLWKKELTNLEEIIVKKDNEIRLIKFNDSNSLEEANKKIRSLESKLKNEKPHYQAELTTEAIYAVLEKVKNTFEAQLSRLEEEVEILRKEKEQQNKIEPLPEYLQTSRTQNRMGNYNIHTLSNQLKRPIRPISGPPMDTPIKWNNSKEIVRNNGLSSTKNNPNFKKSINSNHDEMTLKKPNTNESNENEEFLKRVLPSSEYNCNMDDLLSENDLLGGVLDDDEEKLEDIEAIETLLTYD